MHSDAFDVSLLTFCGAAECFFSFWHSKVLRSVSFPPDIVWCHASVYFPFDIPKCWWMLLSFWDSKVLVNASFPSDVPWCCGAFLFLLTFLTAEERLLFQWGFNYLLAVNIFFVLVLYLTSFCAIIFGLYRRLNFALHYSCYWFPKKKILLRKEWPTCTAGKILQISSQKEPRNFNLGKLHVPMEAHTRRRQYKLFNLDPFQ